MSVTGYTKAKTDALLAGKQDAGDYATHSDVAAAAQNADGGTGSTWPPTVLPRVTITTAGGAPINDTVNYVNATMTINGATPYSGALQIRGRGNTTWLEVKKPYRLKLGATASLLGMPAEKDWVLLANYLDQSAIRTAVAFEMGQRSSGLAWTPRMRFVEVVLNGAYLGLYQLGEHVEISAQKINVTKATGTTGLALTGAYTLEIDQRLEADAEIGFRTPLQNVPVTLDDPDGLIAEQKAYIQTWINTFEAALYSPDWLDPALGYARFVDQASFIDWYLINELCKNSDSNFFSSCKLYKTRDTDTVPGRLVMGPLWDFDRSLGNLALSDPLGWHTRAYGSPTYPGAMWIDRMMQDPAFFAQLLTRWDALAASLSTGDSIYAAIDRMTDRLTFATARDGRTWSYAANGPALGDTMKNFLKTRIDWMGARFHDTTAPTAPTGLTGTPGSAQVGLTWSAATDNGGVVRYRVRRDGVIVGTPTDTSFTDTGLTTGTSYSYTVSALDIANNESTQTAAVTVTPSNDATPPSTPTDLAAGTPTGTTVPLTWTASTDDVAVTGYRVYRGGTRIGSPTGTSYTATGLTASTGYSFTVSAIDAAGNESPQTAAVTATTTADTTTGLLSETWTGTDGAAWPTGWDIQGGAGTIVANRGRLTSNSYFVNAFNTGMTAVTGDFDLTVTFMRSGTLGDQTVVGLGDSNAGRDTTPANGYIVKQSLTEFNEANDTYLVQRTNNAETVIAQSFEKLPPSSVGWKVRVQRTGTTVQAKVWPADTAEPATWRVTGTDTAPLSIGLKAWLSQGGGAAYLVDFDDLSIA